MTSYFLFLGVAIPSEKLIMKVLVLVQILVVVSFQDSAESAAICGDTQTCIPLSDCPEAFSKVSDKKAFQTNLMVVYNLAALSLFNFGNFQLRQYLNSITCGWYGTDSKVCCNDDGVIIDPKVVPETTKCGVRTGATNTLISGGEDAAPGDWPWMVLLQNSNKNL